MKVLSIPQPHALLAVHGYMTIASRSVDTNHRGWLAIHASKEMPVEYAGMLDVWPVPEIMVRINRIRWFERQWGPLFEDEEVGFDIPLGKMDVPSVVRSRMAESLPRGAIVGLVWLAKTEDAFKAYTHWNRREDAWRLGAPDYNDVPSWEPSFGDYRKGNRAWWFCHPVPLKTPVPVEAIGPGLWDTLNAADRDRQRVDTLGVTRFDAYEEAVYRDIAAQDITLPDMFDPAFYRLINRRGETDATRPVNL